MKQIRLWSLLASLVLLSGCIPVPHRRVHVYGVEGRVLDAETRAPVRAACVSPDGGQAISRNDGTFKLRPVYGWHGAYLIGPISYSLLPHFDMPHFGPAVFITAQGYQSQSFGIEGKNCNGAYIEAGDILLKRQ
jgi:hypothetical protein